MEGLRSGARAEAQGHGDAWSAAWGAMAGAGSVLLLAAVALLWRRPRKRGPPLLAPMDMGTSVSTNYILKCSLNLKLRRYGD